MAGLHDTNLVRASDELDPLRRALPAASPSAPFAQDAITPVLAWIDWNESQLTATAGHLAGGSATAAGELKKTADELDDSRADLMTAWQGEAAALFDGFAKAIIANCHQVVDDLKKLKHAATPETGDNIVDGMKKLTKSVWRKAGEIADDPTVKQAIRDAGAVPPDGATWQILNGAHEDLKAVVILDVKRIPEAVSALQPYTRRAELKDPRRAPDSRGQLKGFEYDSPVWRVAGRRLILAYEGFARSNDLLLQAYFIPRGTLGTSQEAHDAERLWQKAVAARGVDLAECAKWTQHMLNTLILTYSEYAEADTKNLKEVVDMGREYQLLTVGDPNAAYRRNEKDTRDMYGPDIWSDPDGPEGHDWTELLF